MFMKAVYLLYILLPILAYFIFDVLRSLFGGPAKRTAGKSENLSDLSLALKNEKAREEFSRKRNGNKATYQTLHDHALSTGDFAPGSLLRTQAYSREARFQTASRNISSPNELLPEKLPSGAPLENEAPSVAIQRISVPSVIEQGQKDVLISITARNLGDVPVILVTVRLQFHQTEKDVGPEYKVYARAGNPTKIEPGCSEELVLMANVSQTASLGRVTLVPVILAKTLGNETQMVNLATSKLCQWNVEPCGRKFSITTEHRQVETAGAPFWVALETRLNDALDPSYHGEYKIDFSMPENSGTQFPSSLSLMFHQGKAKTDRVFCLCNAADSYVIKAKNVRSGGAEGVCDPIQIEPAELGNFRFDLTTPQKNRLPFEGHNTLIALDIFNNIKSDFNGSVEIASSEGEVKGLPGGNLIREGEFSQGSADLTMLGLEIELQDASQDAKIVKLMARTEGITGYSKEITILPQFNIAPSATQAMIRRLWGFRKKKLWVVNSPQEISEFIDRSFKDQYDVSSLTLDPDNLQRLSSNPPDVLFLDSGESIRDGYKILQNIRNSPNMESLPIFFIGPSQEVESKISEVFRSGGIYLTKPLAIAPIKAMVSDMLENLSLGQGRIPSEGSRLQGSEGHIYQIVTKKGEGGMGYVYEARRLRDQKKVIIKYLPPREFNNVKSILRFVQEARTVLEFNHENLVTGYDVLMDRNRCFYVMEYIEGKTLEEIMNRERKLDPLYAIRIVLQVVRALQEANKEYNLVHRDIKPSNVIVTDEGIAKLVDFGIARVSEHHVTNLTTDGIILGTPYYLSPEQTTGQEVTIRSDIYSLGATFYHMISGQLPFQGPDVLQMIQQRVNHHPIDPRHHNPAIPEEIAQVVLKMMRIKPEERYQTPEDIIFELERIIQCFESGFLVSRAGETARDERS